MDDAEVRARVGELVAGLVPQARSEAYKVWQRAPHALEMDELESLALSGLAAAGARWPTYCVAPDVRVLTADMLWVEAGDLAVGREIVGFDEYPVRPGEARRYRRATVTGTGRRVLPSLLIKLEDGREVVCSRDHRWLTYRRHGDYRQRRLGLPANSRNCWWEASELRVGDQILSPFEPWENRRGSFEDGWLSGIYDGEGSVGRNFVSVAQKPGDVLDHVRFLLKQEGIRFTERTRERDGVGVIQVGQRRDAMYLLGWLQPLRLLPKSANLWEGRFVWNRRERCAVTVTGIEDIGEREVVTLQTSTKTFLAEGLASHNCAEKGHDPAALEYFVAYALRRMRGSMMDWLRQQDWVTRSARTRAKLLRDAGQDRGLTAGELAAATGMDIETVRSTIAAVSARPVSMDAEPHDVQAPDDVEGQAVVSQVLSAACGVIDGLDGASRAILVLRYYHGMTVAELAGYLGLAPEEADRLYQAALFEVHGAMLQAVA